MPLVHLTDKELIIARKVLDSTSVREHMVKNRRVTYDELDAVHAKLAAATPDPVPPTPLTPRNNHVDAVWEAVRNYQR